MIICAAISIKFNCAGKTVKAVIPDYRHSSVWELMATLGIPAKWEEVEGFLDHHGQFFNRLETYDHALMCGQLSDTTLTS